MKRGFTLIELLVVIGIISVLMGMMFPLYGIARRAALKNASEFVLKKVETGLHLFRTDWKVYPGQPAYPAAAADLTNRLYYHLGSDITPAKRLEIQLDAQEAGALFAYNATGGATPVENSPQPSPLTYTKTSASGSIARAALLNRMGRDHARLAAISGNLWLRGPVIATATAVVEDKRTTPVFPSPHSAADPGPGWACDYLAGELEAKYRDGPAVLDAWGRPLVYICQVVPGILGSYAVLWQAGTWVGSARSYGLGPIGFDPAQGPGPALATTRPWLLYGGRIVLGPGDAGDGKGPAPADATCLPDPANPFHSDIRYYAPARFVRDFELWSGGPDQAFDYMRDAAANRDNLAVTPYHRDF